MGESVYRYEADEEHIVCPLGFMMDDEDDDEALENEVEREANV